MDKNKIIEAAAKLVAKGAYDKAIKEYQKVLEADPKDVRVLQKMGELYQKKNDNPQAAHYFTKVAESYSSDGFFLKAVALYKQVLKLNPNLLDVNLKLAELHQQLGLMSEAMAYFQIVANHYDKQGDTKQLLDTLKRMVDLDPENVASKIKLGELYAKENMPKEAIAEFRRASEYLKRNARTDDYVRVAERLSALEPENIALAKELASTYLGKGDQKRALARLQVAFKADGRDVETLNLLAQAFQGLGQTSKTVSVYKELAKVYQDSGRGQEANSVWDKIAEIDPQDPDLLARAAAPGRAPAAGRAPALGREPGSSATLNRAPAAGPAPALGREPGSSVNRVPAPAAGPAPALGREPGSSVNRVPAPAAAGPAPALGREPGSSVNRAPAPAPAAAAPARAPAPAPAPAPEPARPGPQTSPPRPVTATPAPTGPLTREQLAKLLTETDVYVKYGLHDKALEHLRKIFAVDPENLDAHEKAYNIYVAAGNTVQASEQLLNVLRLCTRREEVQRAQPYLVTILQQNPNHPEVPAFLAVLRVEHAEAPAAHHVESLGDDEILVESNDEEIVVAEAPEDALARPPGDDLALAAISGSESDEIVEEGGSTETVISDEALVGETIVSGSDADESLLADETTSTNLLDEPLMAGSADEEMSFADVAGTSAEYVVDEPAVSVEDEPIVEDEALGGVALGDDEPPPTRPSMPSAELLQSAAPTASNRRALGSELDVPTRVSRVVEPVEDDFSDSEVTSAGVTAYEPEEATVVGAVLGVETPADEPFAADYSEPEAATHPTEAVGSDEEPAATGEEPASEECDEASFFLDQGLTEEAREILETVMIAFPGHVRAGELMARLEALEADGGTAPTTEETEAESASVPAVEPMMDAPSETSAFDLAAELAEDFGGLADETPAPAASEDDFQYSVEEVFAEFKKGLEKVVKPEDVDTHYDLGIAYKEMGLSDDALGEFAVARKGSVGTKRELDCITMIGMLHGMRGEHEEAVKVFKEGLSSEHAKDEAAKALGFELALAYEAMGENGKALYHYQRVAELDPKYRDVSSQVSRLSELTEPEDDPIVAKPKKGPGGGGAPPAASKAPPAASAGAPKARKVGYV
ncbi:tetratricopeptide repeat protein [Hyalangium versicolor]|uniref:tetratricopeptide repeat protein n=1 Tax=Hyalangium versicolor TaxID=2861190 RepID=UPI001CCA3BEA|nr:tetratricopeptide repeat protein [Hyalangium versicolor]